MTREPKDWIVLYGQPVNSIAGGGFEFFGPFTEEEAHQLRSGWAKKEGSGSKLCLAIQLLKPKV